MAKNLKIIIPLILCAIMLICYIFSLFLVPTKTIEISSGARVKILVNRYDKVRKVEAINTNGELVLDNIEKIGKNPTKAISEIIKTSNDLEFIKDDAVEILFVSKNLLKDKPLLEDISSELLLTSKELSLNNDINQYKITKKDYKVLDKIKKSTNYDTFKIVTDGFISAEKDPYVISVTYKDDCYFVNFSKDIVFNGKESVICRNGTTTYKVTPAGYNKSTLAVFVEGIEERVALEFSVSIKNYDNLLAEAIAYGFYYENDTSKNTNVDDKTETKDDTKDNATDEPLNYAENRKKLDSIRTKIGKLSSADQAIFMDQYNTLEVYVTKVTTKDDLADFNKMASNLEKSINTLLEIEDMPPPSPMISDVPTPSPSPTQSSSPTPSPSATPSPSKAPTPSPSPSKAPVTDLKALNDKYYEELNVYKATVLNIKNAEDRTRLNKEINNLYYELSVCETQSDYDDFTVLLDKFLVNLAPFR